MKRIIFLLLISAQFAYGQVVVPDLTALRSAAVPGYYQVTGEVFITSADLVGGHKAATVQDAGAAVAVYDQNDLVTVVPTPSPYTGVTGMRGNLTTVSGILVFIPDQDPTATGNTLAIVPEDVTVSALTANPTDYESELIRIVDATIDPSGDVNFVDGTLYPITDSTGSTSLRSGFTPLIGDVIPTTTGGNVTGIAGNGLIAPRGSADLDSFPIAVADLTELRSVAVPGRYEVTGEVFITSADFVGGHNMATVQDAGAAVAVYDQNDLVTVIPTPSPYTGVTGMRGNLTTVSGILVFVPDQDPTATGNTSAIVPEDVTVSALTANPTDYESELIRIVDATIDPSGDTNFVDGTLYPITDSTGSTSLRSGFTPLVGDEIPTTLTKITGIAGNGLIAPRNGTDLDSYPTLNVPSDISVNVDSGVCGAIVTYTATATDVEDGSLTPTQTSPVLVSGDVFPVGTTTVTFEVTDSHGNLVSDTFDITVTDNEAPVADVTPLTDIMEPCEIVDNAALLAYSSPTATDNCGGTVTVTNNAVFPIEASVTISWTYEDENGNTSTQDQEVIINDTSDPIISCPTDVDADTEPSLCGAHVSFAVPSAIDPDGSPVTVDQTDATGFVSGDVFPVGNTVIEFTATDECGNETVCTFNITVTDVEAPVAMCQDMTVELDAAGAASITPADIDNGSTDNCSFTLALDNMTFSCGDVGANTVTLTVTDASGNEDTCTATVTVEDNQAPVVMCKGSGGTFNVLEEFEAATIPSGWSTDVYAGTWDWTFGSGAMPGTADFATNAAIFSDDAAGSGAHNGAALLSPVYDLSAADTAELSFDYALGDFAGSGYLLAGVWDGTGWNMILLADDADIAPVNSGVIDMMPYANADFQIVFVYDDEDGGWNWGAGVDNFKLDYNIPPTPPLEVDLMADGTVSVPAGDLLVSVTDNCGYTVGAGSAAAGNIETTFAGGNGFDGNMFDIKAINNLTIDSFDINIAAGTTDDIEVYAKTGTYVGSESTPGDWTLLATVNVTSAGDGSPTPLNLSLGYEMAAGETHAFYVTTVNGGMNYTNGGTTGDVYVSDDNLEFYEGAGGGYFNVTFSPRIFNGNIYYTTGAMPTVDFDCSNLGENSVDVVVTDAGGNETTCTATVVVSDVTAPVLVCGPDPLLYGSNSASDSPSTAFGDGNATFDTVINITDDFTLTDLNVVMDITHAYIGDIQLSLTSPAGTTVVLFDGLCGPTADLNLVFDDEGLDDGVTCGDLQSGQHLDIAAILGYDPLSTFDGENLMGDWTLTVTDTFPPLDDGVLNSWGLEYEYSYPNPSTDINIELDATGNYTITPDDMLSTLDEACGIDVILTDVTDVDCSDIGAPILVTVFANDASGNFASCQHEVNVVDTMAPVLSCGGDQNVPSNNDGMYEIPDYFELATASATDNCTDAASIVLTQTPAPGTFYGITEGTANEPIDVVFTATDAQGNVATCQFELRIRNGIGVTENTILSDNLDMFPNPATQSVTIRNNSDFTIDTAMVYDINGKLVKQVDLQTNASFDVSKLDAGVYMVKIIGDEASAVKRLIVE